jgi:uncharacterized membrane protein YqaE (UPF0057 family)
MGKNQDVVQILVLILVGMFIPFLVSVWYSYGFALSKILVAFVLFLVLFGAELGMVYLYFALSGSRANKKIKEYRPK